MSSAGCSTLTSAHALVQEGYGEFQVYHDNGERADMYRQYLKPVQGRDNLTLLTKTRTLKVVLEKRGGRQAARGVQFNSTGPDGIYHTGRFVQPSSTTLLVHCLVAGLHCGAFRWGWALPVLASCTGPLQ